MVRKEDAQPLLHPPYHPDSHKFCSGKGQREDKRNLKFKEKGRRRQMRERQGGGGLCWVWGQRPVILSTYEAKADNYKFKAHLATVSSRPI